MNEEISAEERQAAIDFELKQLFHCSVDLTVDDLPKETEVDTSKQQAKLEKAKLSGIIQVVNEAKAKLEEQKSEGRGKIKPTIAETFTQGNIDKPITDKYITAIPGSEGGRLVMVSDMHGNTEALKYVVRMFLEDDKVQLASLGDSIAGGGKEQLRTLEVLLKLYAKYPERVHLLRGNCEAAIFPAEGTSDEIIDNTGARGWFQLRGRLQDLFYRQPALLVTENGVDAEHGFLPQPEKGQYASLTDIQESGNYIGNIQFPIKVDLKSEVINPSPKQRARGVVGKLEQMATDQLKSRKVMGLVWNDVDTTQKNGHIGGRHRTFVSGEHDVNAAHRAVGTKVSIRGHDSAKLRAAGNGYVIEPGGTVATFHSSAKKGGFSPSVAIVPLDRKIDQITDDMFVEVGEEAPEAA